MNSKGLFRRSGYGMIKDQTRTDKQGNKRSSEGNNASNNNSNNKDKTPNTADRSRSDKPKKPPPSPCSNCGGDHWRSDCPKKEQSKPNDNTKKSYNVQVKCGKNKPTNPSSKLGPTTGSNKTPSDGSKWPHDTSKPTVPPERINDAVVSSVTVSATLPNESDLLSIEAVYADSFVPGPLPGAITELAKAHQSITPAYAKVSLNHGKGEHRCCIDTGSGISLIDAAHHKKFLNHIKVNAHSSFRLQGLGTSLCSGWIEIDLTFASDAGPITR
jgi:hypothetical protein